MSGFCPYNLMRKIRFFQFRVKITLNLGMHKKYFIGGLAIYTWEYLCEGREANDF